jgi:adenylate kinase
MNCKTVVGIYGVPGSGKSTLLSLIRKSHPECRCLERSQVIGMVMEEKGETMKNFHEKSDTEKASIRACAIKMIHDHKGVTVVAGHCSFRVVATTEEESNPTEPIAFKDVFTANDGDSFDVILYLDKHAEEVYIHRTNDNKTSKSFNPELSVEAIVMDQTRKESSRKRVRQIQY